VTAHPEGVNICLDAGDVGAQKVVEGMGYKAHIQSRGKRNRRKKRSRIHRDLQKATGII
jgi:hypothetical protein